MIMEYQPIIGLEIHVELKTKSKMFCGCPADYFGQKPNTCCCPVCLGLPGALPVPNRKAVQWCVMLGMALGCRIPSFSKFDRKNYFYPDLPKGYQISQYDKPFAVGGQLKININNEKLHIEEERIIRIRRVHMEEDTGKLIHAKVNGENCTLIDFNRSGVPLVEIVTEPDIRSSDEARIFLKKLYQIIRYLDISDADMEKGSMRLEPNISVRIMNNESRIKEDKLRLPDYKVEVKNINSFSFAKKAIDFEIARHIVLLKRGETPRQETRGWDEKKNITYSQRSKEEAHDYRYFPEPDIPPVVWNESDLEEIKDRICELPDEKIKRFMSDFSLSVYDASVLADDLTKADFFEQSAKLIAGEKSYAGITPKTLANWIINRKIDIAKTKPVELLLSVQKDASKPKIDEKSVMRAIDETINSNKKVVNDYKNGKPNAIMFLVGGVMRTLKGQADAQTVRKLLEEKLK